MSKMLYPLSSRTITPIHREAREAVELAIVALTELVTEDPYVYAAFTAALSARRVNHFPSTALMELVRVRAHKMKVEALRHSLEDPWNNKPSPSRTSPGVGSARQKQSSTRSTQVDSKRSASAYARSASRSRRSNGSNGRGEL
jgi:hypothetical protein